MSSFRTTRPPIPPSTPPEITTRREVHDRASNSNNNDDAEHSRRTEEEDGDGDGGQDIYTGDPRLSPLEAQVLSEWARLRGNLDVLSKQFQTLSAQPSTLISEDLRLLERKTNLVCTALKSSVYSIVLQAQDDG